MASRKARRHVHPGAGHVVSPNRAATGFAHVVSGGYPFTCGPPVMNPASAESNATMVESFVRPLIDAPTPLHEAPLRPTGSIPWMRPRGTISGDTKTRAEHYGTDAPFAYGGSDVHAGPFFLLVDVHPPHIPPRHSFLGGVGEVSIRGRW